MNWELFFAGIGAAALLLGGNAWLMKIVIGSEINKVMLTIAEKYVSRDEFDRHIERCPYINNK